MAYDRDHSVLGMSLFVRSATTSYYLFGGASDAGRRTGAQTAIMHRAIVDAVCQGLELFDFVGANSPNRSQFKLSFGADLVPYYSISCR